MSQADHLARGPSLGSVFVIGVALAACHLLYLPSIIVDDAFISYRYAHNLAEGQGLVFNPGERVEGYSNFLWVVLTAWGMAMDLDPVAWTRSLGAIAVFGSVMAASFLTRRLTGSNWAALAAAVILACSTAFCSSAMGGLETGFYALLVILAITSAVLGRIGSASVLMGLAAITRPEGAGLCVIATVLVLMVGREKVSWRCTAAMLFPCAVIVTCLLIFRLAYFGQWIPNSVKAKSTMLPLLGQAGLSEWPGLIFNEAGLRYVGGFLRYAFGALILFIVVPILRPGKHRWPATFMLAVSAMGFAVAIYNFGDWMRSFRLLTPYLPVLTILVIWGVVETRNWLRARTRLAVQGKLDVITAALLLYVAVGQFQWRRPKIGANPDAGIAAFLRDSEQPGLLAATDVLGRLGYYAPRVRILDMAGLTDARIAAVGRPMPPFGRNDFNEVLRREPHFIMNNVRTTWSRHLRKSAFAENYWWVDRPRWSASDRRGAAPRFVFVRRGSVLQGELQSRYPDASFRHPVELFASFSDRGKARRRARPV